MIKLGDYNTLTAIRRADQGFYLEGDERSGDILLPNRYVPDGLAIGKEIEVFVYLDQDERLIATTEKPAAKVGEFACLEVAWINQYGAFLKWGLMKDLFCPFREQKQRMEVGKHYIVFVKEDEESHRLMATAKVERYLVPTPGSPTPAHPAIPIVCPAILSPDLPLSMATPATASSGRRPT